MTASPSVTAGLKCTPLIPPSAPTIAASTKPNARAIASESGGEPPVSRPKVAATTVAVPV